MPKSNAFRSVVLEKKIFNGFCCMSLRVWPFVTPGTSFEQKLKSPSPKDAQSQISMHSGQWFLRRRFLKICQNFTFLPFTWPPKRPALDLNKSESPFPRDTSYQIWLKSN